MDGKGLALAAPDQGQVSETLIRRSKRLGTGLVPPCPKACVRCGFRAGGCGLCAGGLPPVAPSCLRCIRADGVWAVELHEVERGLVNSVALS